MKKVLGIISTIIFLSIFFGILICISGVEVVLMTIGTTVLIVGAVMLCCYLLED
jgi:hypothetical protein